MVRKLPQQHPTAMIMVVIATLQTRPARSYHGDGTDAKHQATERAKPRWVRQHESANFNHSHRMGQPRELLVRDWANSRHEQDQTVEEHSDNNECQQPHHDEYINPTQLPMCLVIGVAVKSRLKRTFCSDHRLWRQFFQTSQVHLKTFSRKIRKF